MRAIGYTPTESPQFFDLCADRLKPCPFATTHCPLPCSPFGAGEGQLMAVVACLSVSDST
jgi:hypothetical protein